MRKGTVSKDAIGQRHSPHGARGGRVHRGGLAVPPPAPAGDVRRSSRVRGRRRPAVHRGIDGRDNLGSVRCLNFLLGGVGGVELLEREQCVGKWGEDVVFLLVRPDECEIYVGHAHYEALRPFVAAWGNVEVHTLPPRHIPNEDDEAPKRPDREDEARDDDEQSSDESLGGRGDGSDDSEEEEEEDVLQDFKLTALVSMLTGVTTVGVACTPNGPGEMETERWPLLQAYGIEGVGRVRLFHHEHEGRRHVGRHPPRVFHAARRRAAPRRRVAKSSPPFRQTGRRRWRRWTPGERRDA